MSGSVGTGFHIHSIQFNSIQFISFGILHFDTKKIYKNKEKRRSSVHSTLYKKIYTIATGAACQDSTDTQQTNTGPGVPEYTNQ